MRMSMKKIVKLLSYQSLCRFCWQMFRLYSEKTILASVSAEFKVGEPTAVVE